MMRRLARMCLPLLLLLPLVNCDTGPRDDPGTVSVDISWFLQDVTERAKYSSVVMTGTGSWTMAPGDIARNAGVTTKSETKTFAPASIVVTDTTEWADLRPGIWTLRFTAGGTYVQAAGVTSTDQLSGGSCTVRVRANMKLDVRFPLPDFGRPPRFSPSCTCSPVACS